MARFGVLQHRVHLFARHPAVFCDAHIKYAKTNVWTARNDTSDAGIRTANLIPRSEQPREE